MIVLSDQWRCAGEIYYYEKPLYAGDTVELMRGVLIPAEWGNEWQGQQFSVVIEATLTQILQGSGITATSAEPVIREYQLQADGTETAYVNNKTVLPGQEISKIVRISVEEKTTGNSHPDPGTTPGKTGDRENPRGTPSVLPAAPAEQGTPDTTETGKTTAQVSKTTSHTGSRNTRTGEHPAYLILPLAAGISLLLLLIWILVQRKKRREDEKTGQADLPD